MDRPRRPVQEGRRLRWRDVVAAGCAAVLLAGLIAAPSPAVAGQRTKVNVAEIIPGHYITNYAKVAHLCPNVTGYAWASWITYASATLGTEWVSTASSDTLCPFAAKSINPLIDHMLFRDGTVSNGPPKENQESWARAIQEASRSPTGAPSVSRNVPAGWKCFALQSFWGMTAWSAALRVHSGSPGNDQWAPATGPAAGAGFCVKGGKKDATGAWKGGQFFTWAPDTRTCKTRFKLHEEEDPANPGDVKYKSYAEVRMWDDYDRKSC
jgi:hypothetical protein